MTKENIQPDKQQKPSRRKYIIPAVIVLLCIIGGLIYRAITWESKPDPASEKIIRQIVAKQFNKDPNELSDEDFAKITILRIESKGSLKIEGEYKDFINNTWGNLSDIKLLKKFTNLRELELILIHPSNKNIPKWKKILNRLGVIDLNDRFYIDLKPLKNLKNLTKLNFSYSEINDIKPLKKLKNLNSLIMTDCPNISDEQVEDLQKTLPELKTIR